MASTEIWCLIFDGQSKEPIGGLLSVELSPDSSVHKLKKAIKEEKSPVLNHIAADMLKVWKWPGGGLEEANMESALQSIDFNDKNTVQEIRPRRKINGLGLSPDDLLLIEVPQELPTHSKCK